MVPKTPGDASIKNLLTKKLINQWNLSALELLSGMLNECTLCESQNAASCRVYS